jgi:hypothetical protein
MERYVCERCWEYYRRVLLVVPATSLNPDGSLALNGAFARIKKFSIVAYLCQKYIPDRMKK